VPTVVWVGRVDPLKDLETLVESFAIVRESVPDAVLRLFGPTPVGNEDYADLIRARVTTLGLTEAVTFEGPASPVSSAYEAGNLVVLSSISEGLPYTIIESMMCGRATVSTDSGGVPEVVGDAGVLVPARDPAALAEGIVSVLDDDELRARLALAGRARALNYFRMDQMLGTFRETYRALNTGTLEVTVDTPAAVAPAQIPEQRTAAPHTDAMSA
jgi:glycosyltransferase involved in cell wall biosynthesis